LSFYKNSQKQILKQTHKKSQAVNLTMYDSTKHSGKKEDQGKLALKSFNTEEVLRLVLIVN
jgi:hypothetical protein